MSGWWLVLWAAGSFLAGFVAHHALGELAFRRWRAQAAPGTFLPVLAPGGTVELPWSPAAPAPGAPGVIRAAAEEQRRNPWSGLDLAARRYDPAVLQTHSCEELVCLPSTCPVARLEAIATLYSSDPFHSCHSWSEDEKGNRSESGFITWGGRNG